MTTPTDLVALADALGEVLSCAVCLEQNPAHPCLLSCGHAFCIDCITARSNTSVRANNLKEISSLQGEVMICPVCGARHTDSEKGDQPTTWGSLDQETGSGEEEGCACAMCDAGTSASRYCFTCDKTMCRACAVKHDSEEQTQEHVRVDIVGEKLLEQITCPCHKTHFVTRFCLNCCVMVCRQCLSDSHTSHDTAELTDTTTNLHVHQATNRWTKKIWSLETDIDDMISVCQRNTRRIDEHFSDTKDSIITHYGDLIEKLTARRDSLLEQTDTYYKSISETNIALEKLLFQAQGNIEDMKQALHNLEHPLPLSKKVKVKCPDRVHYLEESYADIMMPERCTISIDCVFTPNTSLNVGILETKTHEHTQKIPLGWSKNFVQNPSGERGDAQPWNSKGVWKSKHDSNGPYLKGYLHKTQEVDLSLHFSEAYLETAPDLEVSECYKEGPYHLLASLINTKGKVVAHFDSKEQRYSGDWTRVTHVFSGYGPGVRRIMLESGPWASWWGALRDKAAVPVREAVVRIKQPNDLLQPAACSKTHIRRSVSVTESIL